MLITETAIANVKLVTPRVVEDDRGFFLESWREDAFAKAGIEGPWVQDNHSRSSKGTLRGIHYQVEQPQGKLVRATRGAIFDVAVDLRRSSATFGQWIGQELNADTKTMLWIPPGFGHGFLALSESAEVQYKCTAYYAAEHDRTLAWDDPALSIRWPLAQGQSPILSAKDAAAPRLDSADLFA